MYWRWADSKRIAQARDGTYVAQARDFTHILQGRDGTRVPQNRDQLYWTWWWNSGICKMQMEHFLDRLSDSQILNKVQLFVCWLIRYEIQHYFYINGLFSNAFSADGRQIDINETAVMGESLVSSQCHFVHQLPHSLLWDQGRSSVLMDRLFVTLSWLHTASSNTVYLRAVATSKVGRSVSAAKKPHCHRNVSYFSSIRFSEATVTLDVINVLYFCINLHLELFNGC
jgi:hypothetical protein